MADFKKISPEDIADFFLAFANERGETVTNLRLQKLVYYAQAWFLGITGKPLFDDDFQAWVHGPVLPSLYHKYKQFGYSPIPSTADLVDVRERLNPDVLPLLEEIAGVYMQFGAYQMELMSHQETPWLNARAGYEADQSCEEVITKQSMEEFYGQRARQTE